MRILSVVRKHYYGQLAAVEPMSLYFTDPLRNLGHAVEEFDHFEQAARYGREKCTDLLVKRIRSSKPDLVFYQTSGKEPVDLNSIRDLADSVCIVAWNSDDDWQWEVTIQNAPCFTYMITTYPEIYHANRPTVPNLLLSQWGCYRGFADAEKAKTIPFSFVGSTYGARNNECRYLRKSAGLECFGWGSRLVRWGIPYVKGALKFPSLSGAAMELPAVHGIWNSSRISYTPLGAGANAKLLQIKGRVFEMGLSGTLMLCDRTSALDPYYTAEEDYISFTTLEECADKARFYLNHEKERQRIARNYYERTLREHTWEDRFSEILANIFPSHDKIGASERFSSDAS
jgi:hypothetical protein